MVSVTSFAMAPTKISTADEKEKFFLDNGWQSSANLVYPGEHLGNLNLLPICAGGQQCGELPNAFSYLDLVAQAFINAAGVERITRSRMVMLEAKLETVLRQLDKKPTAGFRKFYKKLIENTNTSHIVITVSNPKNKFNDAIYIAPAGERGWGAFANEKISTGSPIVEYVGQVWLYNYDSKSPLKCKFVCRKRNLDVSESLRIFHNVRDSVYTASLLPRDPQLILMDHPQSSVEVELGVIIDALKVRNEAAFLNHSRFGNADYTRALKITLSFNQNGALDIASIEYAIYLHAIKNIEKDEELLWDYKMKPGTIESIRAEGILFTDYSPKHACYKCGKDEIAVGRNLSMCKKCETAKYCSRECQVDDWKLHKMYCFDRNVSATTTSSPKTEPAEKRIGS